MVTGGAMVALVGGAMVTGAAMVTCGAMTVSVTDAAMSPTRERRDDEDKSLLAQASTPDKPIQYFEYV